MRMPLTKTGFIHPRFGSGVDFCTAYISAGEKERHSKVDDNIFFPLSRMVKARLKILLWKNVTTMLSPHTSSYWA